MSASSSATARRVTGQPKRTTSTGSGKAPSGGTRLPASAITTSRSLAEATIFSCSSAAPPPLIRFRSPSNSSAPSTVRSIRADLVELRSGTPSSCGQPPVALEVATPVTSSPLADPLGQQPHEPGGGRAGAEAERHPVLDHLQRPRGGGALGEVGGSERHREPPSRGSAPAL